MSINMEKSSGTSLDQQLALPYSIPRVNLLPPEVLERRNVRKAKIGVGAAALASLALVGGAFLLVQNSVNNAEDQLATEQARTATLRTEEAKYAEVPQIIKSVETARAARAEALRYDINVATMLNNIASVYPSNVWVDTLTLDVTAAATGPGAPATSTDPLAAPGIGTFTFAGSSYDNGKHTHAPVAAWLEALGKVDGVSSPRLASSSLEEVDDKVVTKFQNTGVLNDQALTHRYDGEAS